MHSSKLPCRHFVCPKRGFHAIVTSGGGAYDSLQQSLAACDFPEWVESLQANIAPFLRIPRVMHEQGAMLLCFTDTTSTFLEPHLGALLCPTVLAAEG
jgi:hypothetical protein